MHFLRLPKKFFGVSIRRKLDSHLIASECALLSPFCKSLRSFSNTSGQETADDQDQEIEADIITPWNVKSKNAIGVDYEKFLVTFDLQSIDHNLVKRIEKLTGKEAHPMIRRGLFYAHRGLNKILDRFEQKKPFFLYTGRGPSSGSLHLGHLLPFMFAKYLQDTFNMPLIIQMTDDEKFLWNANITLEDARKMAKNNIKDIISVGFDPSKTFIFTNSEYMGPALYANVLKIWKSLSFIRTQSMFGFSHGDSIGKCAFPALEMAPCYSSSFPEIFSSRTDIPCLIPCAIDQDPYFRLAGEIAPHLRYKEPATMYSKFLPALQGFQIGKMSTSEPNSCIFLDDSPCIIKNKINKQAFSGGRETLELHKSLGGNTDVDISYFFLRVFLDDDKQLEDIRQRYISGELLTIELKRITIDLISKIVADLQTRRKEISDETVNKFTKLRILSFK